MLVVQKFGGTSVANLERMEIVCDHIEREVKKRNRVVVVVSAMAGETDRLLKLGGQVGDFPDELDVLVSTGEQVSVALLSMLLRKRGIKAKSYLGWQIPIITDNNFQNARIIKIGTERLLKDIRKGIVPVVAGFQGITEDGRITTLGRGGSDTTAVALCVALRGDICEIYTDVRGVFTSDPSVVRNARKIKRIGYEEMLELASLGAKVLHTRCVELAMRFSVPIRVRSTFEPEDEGTLVS